MLQAKSGVQELAAELTAYPPKHLLQTPAVLRLTQKLGRARQRELARKKPVVQLWQVVAEVQVWQPAGQLLQAPALRNRFYPQSMQELGSLAEHLTHPPKHLVQLVVPVIWTLPE